MPDNLRGRIFEELDALVLIDPHTHINPRAPAAAHIAEILGYHYYTELAHSAGMPRAEIEQPGMSLDDQAQCLAGWLPQIDNTIQFSWLLEMAQRLFGFTDERVTADNWPQLAAGAAAALARPDWASEVLRLSRLEAVFLTNDFDDPLVGFDTRVYVPCLRADELVFGLTNPQVRERVGRAGGLAIHDAGTLSQAVGALASRFVAHGARAAAISLAPDFSPAPVSTAAATAAWNAVCKQGEQADASRRHDLQNFVFWTLAEHCDSLRLPLDLMIGVHRGVYEQGVFQGRDLYDSRVSLFQYRALFNAFPRLTFPISVLASVTNQELASYSWIFPNVVTNGHWWYSNTPAWIERDAAARLEAVPRNKQIGYYSDMYKLEFALPKFAMYKRILAKILAEQFVVERRWSEERAIGFGRQVLRGNVDHIFYGRE